MKKDFAWIVSVLLAAILIDTLIAGLLAFPVGAICYGIFTSGTALTPAITFWGWYGIAAGGIFIIDLLFGNKGNGES